MIHYVAIIAAQRAARKRMESGPPPMLARQRPIYLYAPYTKRRRPSATDAWYRKFLRFITFDHVG